VESSYQRDDDGDGKRDDVELGYNTVRTTLGLVAELAGAHVVTPNQPALFMDDFETDKGWIVDPSGADPATAGRWERADPQPSDSLGLKQLGDAASGSYDLVTGPLADVDAAFHDLDNAMTSIRSPGVELPAGRDITLALKYTFAHARNATADDFFRVRVVGATAMTVLELRGSSTNLDASWTPYHVSLNSFAGQPIYVLIEASDQARDSLLEAAVDDVSITATDPAAPLFAASFDGGADGFAYGDDSFYGTSQPGYAAGAHVPAGGYNGGGLQVGLGGTDDLIVDGISGGWSRDFTLASPGPVSVLFRFKLTQSPDYEDEECSQALVSVDGALYGSGNAQHVAQICGNGNGGGDESTGWQIFSAELGALAAGQHTLVVGGHNGRKSYANEATELLIDDLVVQAQ
jgi:hypothetical protein